VGLLLAAPAAAQGADAYVDVTTGTGALCTLASPCDEIDEGITAAGTGDDVFVDGGTYNEALVLGDGKSLLAMEFAGAPEGPPLIDGGTGFAITVTSNAGTIRGFTIRGDSRAIEVSGSVTIDDNTFDETTPGLVVPATIRSVSGVASVTITDNTFTDPSPSNDQWGINLVSVTQALVEGNTFTGFRIAADINTGDLEFQDNQVLGTHSDGAFAGLGLMYADGTGLIEDNVVGPPVVGSVVGITVADSDPMTAPHTGVTLRRNRLLDLTRGVEIINTPSPVTLDSDLIAGNTEYGVLATDSDPGSEGDTTLTHVTVWDNDTDIRTEDTLLTIDSTASEDAIDTTSGSACVITNSRGPTTGPSCQGFQTAAVPTFVNAAANDYHMTAASPLIDIGNPLAPPLGAIDLDGDARALDGNCDGAVRRDIGADEVPCTPVPPGDVDPPETTIIKKPGKRIESDKTTIKFSSDEPGSTFQCQLDKKPFSPCTSPRRLRKLTPGKHKFQVRAVDPAGNPDPSPVGVKFRVAP
jgi:hypothetical protein